MPRFLASVLIGAFALLCFANPAHVATAAAVASQAGFTDETFASVFGPLDAAFSNGFSTVAADFNGDGTADLLSYKTLYTSANGSEEVQVFLSKSGGGFTTVAAENLAFPNQINANVTPVVIDVDGDGKPDLILGTAVAYGNGDGTFKAPVIPSFLSTGYSAVYAADVTGDGKPDLIALNTPTDPGNTPYTMQVTVLANQGGGGFQSLGTFPIGSGQVVSFATLASLHFADLNGDGNVDMVAEMYFVPAGNAAEPATIAIVLNNGDGTFAAPVPVNYSPQQDSGQPELESLQVADFNGDSTPDLALVYTTQSIPGTGIQTPVLFLPGVGDGTFGAEHDSIVTGATAPLPAGNVIATDINQDGTQDLAFASGAVVSGNGAGSFSLGTAIVSAPSGTSLGAIRLAGSSAPAFVYAAAATNSTPSFPLVAIPPAGIGQVATTTTLTSTANPAYRGETATITVSVRSSGGVPSGTVSFTCGAAPMSGLDCPSTLTLDAQGNASFQAANDGSLDGSLVMTAVTYSGDANHASSTTQYTQVFDDPVNISSSASGVGTITVKSGDSASTQLSVSGNAGFTGAASLSCKNLPANASCVFNPAITSLTATAQIVTLTVSTKGSTSASVQPLFGRGLQTLVCGFFAGSLLLFSRRRRWTHWVSIAIIGLGLLPLGCGGNSSSGGSSSRVPPGTYPFTISGNGGGQESGAQFQLVVQ